ncbi:hypothetical protein KC19_6G034700 [Ceratodon purpureus]|uniref:Uncharacterized protein n=1 Tax=Ceratodon purpureus TaxID=3225 RepID=A0A8T0HCJ3_CERPU|nr:hypothetical protein KC19_6G034700 [Ceratodon purpureus]
MIIIPAAEQAPSAHATRHCRTCRSKGASQGVELLGVELRFTHQLHCSAAALGPGCSLLCRAVTSFSKVPTRLDSSTGVRHHSDRLHSMIHSSPGSLTLRDEFSSHCQHGFCTAASSLITQGTKLSPSSKCATVAVASERLETGYVTVVCELRVVSFELEVFPKLENRTELKLDER